MRSRPELPRGRAGFTLVEVMVAIVITVIVLAGARALLGQIADQGDRITAAAAAGDGEANADALLRTLVGRVEVSGVPGA